MITLFGRRTLFFAAPLLLLILASPVQAQNRPDPSVLNSLNWNQLQWLQDARPTNPGSWYAVLSGNPANGPWVIVNKVMAASFDAPHYHASDRYIYVIKGTWAVGTGANSAALPPGSFVKQSANQVHWDGAKDEDVLLLVSGDTPIADDTFVK